MKTSQSKTTGMVGIVFLVIGAVFLIGGVIWLSLGRQKINAWEKVTGILTDSEYHYDSDGERSERFYITYEFAGKEYTERLNYSTGGMDVGEEHEVYVNPKKPTELINKGTTYVGSIIFIVLGSVFVLVGCVLTCMALCRRARARRLMNGNRMRARIEGCHMNTSVCVNGRHPWVVDCSVIDSNTGEKHIFHSRNIYSDLYYVAENPTAYYVDVCTDMLSWDDYLVDGDTIGDSAAVYSHGTANELF